MPAGSSQFEGRSIPDPGLGGDEGAAPPALVEALRAYSVGNGSAWTVLRELAVGRVLVPVVAVLEESETGDDGLAHDKRSAMAAVLMESASGERSMLAFTCVEALRRWRADARPVPVNGITAARSAVADGATALLVDLAGPTPFAIRGDELQALAGASLAGEAGIGEAAPEAVSGLVDQEAGLLDARLEPAGGRGTTITLVVDPGLSENAYRALMARVTSALAADPELAGRFPDGVRVSVVGPDR
jgi:hypothetical protein